MEKNRSTLLKRFVMTLTAVSLVVSGCSDSTKPPAIRLIEKYDLATIEGSEIDSIRQVPRTEWRFDGTTTKPSAGEFEATAGWGSFQVSDFAVRGGKLQGKTKDTFPIIHTERAIGLESKDLLHSVEIRMKVSDGENLSVAFRSSEKLDLENVIKQAQGFAWRISTPLVPGEVRTYTLTSPFPSKASDIRHVLIRPSDAEKAVFEIESVRLIFRREYLASIPSGIGWHGLAEIYRETLVTRSPEVLTFNLDLPENAWLDLALGTIEDGPLTFQVAVENGGSKSFLLQQTLTRPDRWQSTPVDLSEFAGESIALSLSLGAERSGTLGFWGAPVIRSHGAKPMLSSNLSDKNADTVPRGVILIICDTMRSDHLDVYGYERPTTPQISKIAAEGAVFKDCIAQATWTKVSVPSILTSLYPSVHGVKEFTDRLSPSIRRLPEVFLDAGYATLAMSSVMFTGQFSNMHKGFEVLHEASSLLDKEYDAKTAREYVDRLLPWIEQHKDVPFFVLLHVFDPHDPYEPYRPYDTLWADADLKKTHEEQMKKVREHIADPLLKAFGMPSQDELVKAGIDPDAFIAHIKDWYDGSIRGMDVEIGRLMEGLRSLGLDKSTLVAITSDHGEEFLDHGFTFHGQSVYNELTQVPLILWNPGNVPSGAILEETVQSIDLMPTILELSGLQAPQNINGQSLTSLFREPRNANAELVPVTSMTQETADARKSRPAISEKAIILDKAGPANREVASVALIKDGWKLIENTFVENQKTTFELYKRDNDRLDQTNLAAAHPDILEELKEDLAVWRKKMEEQRHDIETSSEDNLTDAQLKRLRSLGYIK